ncbi:MAG: glycosyltransferase [Candidatus Omnitrophica bacterium]|nr:glycosyltransferase [Candidatus Omnitrophota bacterium]
MISVIINTKDRLNELCRCVGSLIKQEQLPHELIIVDASVDYSKHKKSLMDIIRDSGIDFKFLHTAAGNSYQRNIGIRNLNKDSKFVCFLDDDVILYPDVIRNFIKKFDRNSDIFAIQGVEVDRKPQHFLGKMVRFFFFLGYEGKKWSLLPSGEHVMVIRPSHDTEIKSFKTCCVCLRREVLDYFLFDEWFKGYAFLEDYDFSYRIGRKYKMIISPDIRILHRSEDAKRINNFEKSKMFIINKGYFFFKNIHKKTILNYAAFIWSLIGQVVLNFGKSIYKKDTGYFFGTSRGFLALMGGILRRKNISDAVRVY